MPRDARDRGGAPKLEPTVSLVEVFAAPQGEGRNAGRWAIFVRFAGCPLACEFAPGVVCDTPYMKARHKVTLDALFDDMIAPLIPKVRTFGRARLEDAPMLILTGGEPTASPQFDAVVLRAMQHTPTFYVAVETNGTTYRETLETVDWITVSPKDQIAQTSTALAHNHNPQSSKLSREVITLLSKRAMTHGRGGEYRYVIADENTGHPIYYAAPKHYVSPAVLSDGSGEEWRKGFPGFAPGAVDRCLEITRNDPRWRISVQIHKVIGVR
ncbi:hypothetical protein LCGC14_0446720 [marine sediment metagenome]|uniref:Radical SAM core domain-containing protein n=1 Tax=marine sediment metagenome TaxID=412755 RepID=A0A0F9V5T9_9ZZZZ